MTGELIIEAPNNKVRDESTHDREAYLKEAGNRYKRTLYYSFAIIIVNAQYFSNNEIAFVITAG